MNENQRLVFDASALIVLINKESGWENIPPLLSNAIMSSVNIAEVAKFLKDKKNVPIYAIKEIINNFIPNISPFNNFHAYISAELVEYTKKYGLSLGDRACISLAQEKNLPVFTADKIWKNLEQELNLEVLLVEQKYEI